MASVRGPTAWGATRAGTRTSSLRPPDVEEIVPSSGWTEDSAGHYLLVDLPEFRKEEVKLQVDSYGRIIVKGERQANERKRVHFHLTFPVPLDSDTDTVTGKFDAGILYVTVPKRIPQQEHKESEAEQAANDNVERTEENERQEPSSDKEEEERDRSQHDSHGEMEEKRSENEHTREFSEGLIRKWKHEPMLRNAVEVLRKNKGIVITAVIAFSLGFILPRKFQFSTAS